MDNNNQCWRWLPAELWMEVFKQLNPHDIFHAVARLNGHFNQLVQSPSVFKYLAHQQKYVRPEEGATKTTSMSWKRYYIKRSRQVCTLESLRQGDSFQVIVTERLVDPDSFSFLGGGWKKVKQYRLRFSRIPVVAALLPPYMQHLKRRDTAIKFSLIYYPGGGKGPKVMKTYLLSRGEVNLWSDALFRIQTKQVREIPGLSPEARQNRYRFVMKRRRADGSLIWGSIRSFQRDEFKSIHSGSESVLDLLADLKNHGWIRPAVVSRYWYW